MGIIARIILGLVAGATVLLFGCHLISGRPSHRTARR
jgi:hypothetical protein